MALSDAAKISAAGAIATRADLIKLHSGLPGATGTANVIAGAQAAVTYVAGAAGEIDVSAAVTIAVPQGATVSHFSLWDATVLLAEEVFTSNAETYANAGQANITSAKVTIS